jgi:hypothetical protein
LNDKTYRRCLVPLVLRDGQFLSHFHFSVMMAETDHDYLQGILSLLLDSLFLGGRAPLSEISCCAVLRAAARSGSFDGEVGHDAEREGKCP